MKIVAITPNKKHDYLTSSIIEGLIKNNIEVIASDKGNGIKKKFSDKQLIEHSKDADYILAFFGKIVNNKPPKYYLLEKVNHPEITAYIDGSEWTYTGYPEENQVSESKRNPKRRRGKKWINENMYDNCKWYFKRECYPQDTKMGVIPLLFAAEEKYFGNYKIEKRYDVFYSFGQNQTGLRRETKEICKRLRREGFNIIIEKRLKYQKYLKIISSSYITVDAWGGGDCCARIWEAIANKSCCFSQKYNILFPNKFIDGESFVEYSTSEEFEEKLRFYLDNKDKCLDIAGKGYHHLLKYHTSKERVKYMLNIMKN